jgi:ABC-type hemin transport system ATPase subunit
VLATAAGLPLERVDEVLDEVGLAEAGDRRVKGFSLGMRQRLGLASALLGAPNVLILDEPTNGLDPEGVHWLRQYLRSFADRGGNVLVSSHLLAEVAQTVDDVRMVGVGVGSLVTNQTLAVAVTLTWLLLVEAMVVSFARGPGRWLPGGTPGAMSGAATYSNLLPVGAAALLFAGYGLAFAAAGSRFVLRRDIT